MQLKPSAVACPVGNARYTNPVRAHAFFLCIVKKVQTFAGLSGAGQTASRHVHMSNPLDTKKRGNNATFSNNCGPRLSCYARIAIRGKAAANLAAFTSAFDHLSSRSVASATKGERSSSAHPRGREGILRG